MKTHLKKLFFSSMLLTFMFAFMFTFRSGAASDLSQVSPKQTSITLKWKAPEGVTGYTVKIGTSYSDVKKVATLSSTATSYTIKKLKAGQEYYVRVEYTYQTTYGSYDSYYSGYFKTTPGKVTNVHQDRWYYYIKSFDVDWDRQDYGTKYEYIVKTSKGKKKAKGTTSSNTLSVDKVSNSMVYTVKVRASNVINGKTYTGPWSVTCYCFTQPRVTSLKLKGNKLTVKWGKVTGVTGYDVYVSTKAQNGYKKVKSVKSGTSSVTISKLKGKKISSKKRYYVYVVAKKKVGKKTSTSGRLYYWST